MREDLLRYYESELTYLRQLGGEFAARYPKIAGRLSLEESKCDDPHVERMIEGFAFLAARIHLKLDDEFPEITEGFYEALYPHYIRPVPSMTIAEFHLDPEQGKLTTGFTIRKNALLETRRGALCRFATCFESTLWPITVTNAQWKTPDRVAPPVRAGEAVAVLKLDLRCQGELAWKDLEVSQLRFYLSGSGETPYNLYELLLSRCRQIVIRDGAAPAQHRALQLPATALRAVGFDDSEAVLPYSKRSFQGYRLLQEYFSFPQKFLFVELGGLDVLRTAGFGPSAEVLFYFDAFDREDRQPMLEAAVRRESIRLNCLPAVNLFPQTSEPILLSERKTEYRVVPDAKGQQTVEIFSIDDVMSFAPGAAAASHFEPFYSNRHSWTQQERPKLYWYSRRRPADWRRDAGTDVFLSLVDLANRPARPDAEALTARLTCFNRDLPSQMTFGSADGDFQLLGGSPVARAIALVKPSAVYQPPLGQALFWRLISQLSLNYLSIVDGGAEALREILQLHNFADSPAVDRQIAGLTRVTSAPALTQLASAEGMSFVRGRRVELEFDEENFAGSGAYLFASVIEHFLGLYVSLNSYVVTEAQAKQRKEPLGKWPPRSGSRVVL